MPQFTLIKHPDNTHDAEVTVTFNSDLLDVAKAHFHDFLKASGFEIPLEVMGEPTLEKRISVDDFLAKEEDWLWNDAIDSKFRNDGPVGSAGADVIKFPISDS